ncbi:AMP-dependent synthetase/ligase [Acididesulfobacillus acetoxydans]|uniref:AMP-dependent synthetase/ligase n=1 Tax=Acididesulfobacillus acetoxydans TaxID=1561005 RepID=A0A8S0XWU8_9FIRM|nr:fatty acyl-CoA synthetase [Acididesulfobacillus acetoxydans]CAA7601287.1 AMP-dependent synthetase/ligase [Acididesulfobacillus acetoxydans]CEJ08803.1 Long-chain-fatty-acid--CoA ligase [Acididesulfobacillus acetoxydans]
MFQYPPLTPEEREHYDLLNEENVRFLRRRYNHINRWVVADISRRSAYRYPDKPALIYRNITLSYRQLEEESNRVANALIALGLKKYDRIAILAHNTIDHVLTWLGTAKAGGVYLAVNYLLRGKDIAYCLNHSEATVFIVEDALYDLVKDILGEIPTVKTLFWSRQGSGQEVPAGFSDFEIWYRQYTAAEPDVELQIEDPVQMTYTSGTESLPKGVILSNQSLLAEYTSCIIDGEYTRHDVILNALPIYHCAQRDVFLTPAFMVGATNILMFNPNVKEIMENIVKYRVTIFFAPPTVWISLMRHPEFENFDLSSIAKGYYGASIMPVAVLKEVVRRLPGCQRFYNYYGQTELGPYHTMLRPEDMLTKPGSAGTAGLNMESQLEDLEHRALAQPGIPGEICGRGPHAMLLYFKDPDKTEKTFEHGWFHSGDIGILDEDRYITVIDRKKDMVKTGGENVPGREVEEIIYQDGRVSEVAVIGLPHEKWVEAVTALVVPKPGNNVSEEEIIQLCRENLPAFKVPKGVIFLPELPKTPSGKILKRDLRSLYAAHYLEQKKAKDLD